jgi:hypothetical protein
MLGELQFLMVILLHVLLFLHLVETMLKLCPYLCSHRGGRGGGYKELDEEELEETKRRRKEAEVRYSCGAVTLRLFNTFLFYIFHVPITG